MRALNFFMEFWLWQKNPPTPPQGSKIEFYAKDSFTAENKF